MFRTLSPGDSISVAQRKLLQRGTRECQAIYKFATRKQVVWTSKIRCQVKVFSILCMGRCKSLASLNLFLSYASQLSEPILFACSPCFLHSPSSSAVTMGLTASIRSQFWEARNRWWLWHFLLIHMTGDIFISQYVNDKHIRNTNGTIKRSSRSKSQL